MESINCVLIWLLACSDLANFKIYIGEGRVRSAPSPEGQHHRVFLTSGKQQVRDPQLPRCRLTCCAESSMKVSKCVCDLVLVLCGVHDRQLYGHGAVGEFHLLECQQQNVGTMVFFSFKVCPFSELRPSNYGSRVADHATTADHLLMSVSRCSLCSFHLQCSY